MACYKNRKKQQKKINKIVREINKILNQEKLLAADLYFLDFHLNRYNRKTERLWERVTLCGNNCEPVAFIIYDNTNINEILHYIAEHIKNIRGKLKSENLNPIETVWGVGYKWRKDRVL